MTQSETILNHFLAGKSLSTFEAYELYGITTLGQRCTDLRRENHPIQSEWVEQNGKRFKRYFLQVDELNFAGDKKIT